MIDAISRLFGRKPRRKQRNDPDFGELEYVDALESWHGAVVLEGQTNAVELLIRVRGEPSEEQRHWLRDFMQLGRQYSTASSSAFSKVKKTSWPWF